MFVSRSMTRKVITVEPEAGIFEAQELMAANRIRHLPVIEPGGRLIGIVTDRDIRSALPYKFFKESSSEEEKKKFSELKIKSPYFCFISFSISIILYFCSTVCVR